MSVFSSTAEENRRSKTPLIAGIALIAILGLLGWGLINSQESPLAIGESAPEVQFAFFPEYEWNGKSSAYLSEMKGNVVVVNIWASWCPPCRDEAPILELLWQDYHEDGVIFVGVAYLDTEPNSLAFMEEFDASYPNAPDLRSVISERFELGKVPETFIIDREGLLRQKIDGAVNYGAMASILDALLAE